ncbi:YwiC-like protein [Bifidobacterium biavatii DSM 23969]|uniref:YwiC-like protein n=2 Tax=Bifidobacterium biavatii TaxID=762212 RepID=A0A086ZMT8_9BIFI|nr:YwiC-like protein [Bifidobacterium biavatii DSM 23969]
MPYRGGMPKTSRTATFTTRNASYGGGSRRGGSSTRPVLRDWIPDQPGAWVMAMLPALSGVAIGGATVNTIWMLAAWALCYCVQFTAARWIKSRFSRRYAKQVLIYTVLLFAVGLPFLNVNPGVLRWAPYFAALAAISFAAAYLRRERSLWGNGAAVLASSSMPTVIASFGDPAKLSDGCAVPTALTNGLISHADCVRYVEHGAALFRGQLPTPETWWSTYALPSAGLAASLLFALTQFGSVLFVKTMIRERGNRRYLRASWGWHGMLLALCAGAWLFADPSGRLAWLRGGWSDPSSFDWKGCMMTVVAACLLLRAIVLPIVAKNRRLKPIAVGMTELSSNLLVFAASVAF